MPKTDEPGRQVKGTLKGYYLWAFDLVKGDQGGETGAMEYIVGRWLDKDREDALGTFQIGREAYRLWKSTRPEEPKGPRKQKEPKEPEG